MSIFGLSKVLNHDEYIRRMELIYDRYVSAGCASYIYDLGIERAPTDLCYRERKEAPRRLTIEYIRERVNWQSCIILTLDLKYKTRQAAHPSLLTDKTLVQFPFLYFKKHLVDRYNTPDTIDILSQINEFLVAVNKKERRMSHGRVCIVHLLSDESQVGNFLADANRVIYDYIETMRGHVDVKTELVHFHLTKQRSFYDEVLDGLMFGHALGSYPSRMPTKIDIYRELNSRL